MHYRLLVLPVHQTDACKYYTHRRCPITWRKCSKFRINDRYWKTARKTYGRCELSVVTFCRESIVACNTIVYLMIDDTKARNAT